jgi:hypothetical protein
MQNLAINQNLWYSFGMVGSQSLSGDRRKGVAQGRFLQPDARVAQPGEGSQDFFI